MGNVLDMQSSVAFFEVTDVKTNQVYVTKILEKSTLAGEDRRKIRSEAKFTELDLNHKNIVRY